MKRFFRVMGCAMILIPVGLLLSIGAKAVFDIGGWHGVAWVFGGSFGVLLYIWAAAFLFVKGF